MSNYIKHGIDEIKSTKKYARDKNVNGWWVNVLGAVMLCFFISMLLSIFSIIFLANANPNGLILNALGYGILSFPLIIGFVLMMSTGKYLIKSMIYFTYLIQQGMMKGINRLDMYFWRKTGKDGVASNFILKHRKLVQILIFTPLIILMILRHLPK